MTIGTIIFANGFLFAGLASFVYFLMTVWMRRKKSSLASEFRCRLPQILL